MAITREQLLDIGFKPSKMAKGMTGRKYDSLIYRLNKTDYVYLGYNKFTKKIDFKRMWKCFKEMDSGEIITIPVEKIGELSYENVKDYIRYCERIADLKHTVYG